MNKKIVKPTLLLLMVCIFKFIFLIQPANANLTIIYVDNDNLTGPWHGTPDSPFQNITSGLDHASENDTIFVRNGTYHEKIEINKTLSIIGENRETTTIDGDNNGTVIKITKDNVTITGFTIQNSGTESPDCGIFAWKCSAVRISNSTVRKNLCGISLLETNCSYVTGNIITNNSWRGISISIGGDGNTIYFNNISMNGVGVYVGGHSSIPNTVYNNNFLDNPMQAEGTAEWDNGAEGNYWSDYTGLDDGSNERVADDGIGDTDLPYLGIDEYPLMGLVTFFNVGTWQQITCYIHVSSNSTISDFKLNETAKTISFNVTNKEVTTGFCRIAIPNIIVEDLWNYSYAVLLNGETWPFRNWTNMEDTYIYVNYTHSEHEITIIPEFLDNGTLWLMIITTFILIITIKKKRSTNITTNDKHICKTQVTS